MEKAIPSRVNILNQNIKASFGNSGLPPRGFTISTKTVVVIVAIIGLLVIVSFLSLAGDLGREKVVTTTTTAVPLTVVPYSYDANLSGAPGSTPEQIYSYANESIVTLQGVQGGTGILGSGFILAYQNSYYVVTNYHVAGQTSDLTVTFYDGDSYPAKVIGTDAYSDLAVVSVQNAPSSEYHPLKVASSASLKIGEYVLAIGNPFGLTDSMTFGIVSALGRTIQDPTAGNFSIPDAIQFSAPINPGNSGGVLLDGNGSVVGIPTASISGSQGVGFAIPSDTLIREFPLLVSTGSYTLHSYLGIDAVDNFYQLAQSEGTSTTYGVVIESVVSGGPAAQAGLRGGSSSVVIEGQQYAVGGDIIVSANGTKIENNDALAAYLAENTLPGQTIVFGIIRSGTQMNVDVVLGTRPPVS
jgi:S1-C subfamily serine protease